jgi:hypothetical protein
MDALKSFLDWFEGFSDNIGEAPNAQQWSKIVARIARLGEEVTEVPRVPAVVVDAHVRNGVVAAATAAPVTADQGVEVAAAKPQGEMTLAELYLVDEKKAKALWRKRYETEIRSLDSTISARDAKDLSDTAGIQWDVTPEEQARQDRAAWDA